jgi:hypothetical protein
MTPLLLATLAWLSVCLTARPSFADVHTWIEAVGERLVMAAGGATRPKRAGLDRAIARLAATPAQSGTVVLAAHAGPEGHWTFVNRSAERFTAGTPEELSRVLSVLAPSALRDDARLQIILSGETVFVSRAALRQLSRLGNGRAPGRNPVRFSVALQSASYPLVTQVSDKSMRLFAEVRPRVFVEMTSAQDFEEALWQLTHRLRREHIRVVALEADGPAGFTASPKFDTRTRRVLADRIDSAHLLPALTSIRGQTAILIGRIEGDGDARRLLFRTSSGADRSLLFSDLAANAAKADVNLMVLSAATPRQPGGRNWLWIPVAVDRLEEAVARQHLADFLDALMTGDTRLVVSLARTAGQRVRLQATPAKPDTSTLTGVGDALGEIVWEAAGRVVVSGLTADLRSFGRQVELDARVMPGIPSLLQLFYLALLALGLIGWKPACRWWARIWPAEQRQGYAGLGGYVAARVTRLAAFLLVFLPLAAPISVPTALIAALVVRRRPETPLASPPRQ